MLLNELKCSPIDKSTPPLASPEVQRYLNEIKDWNLKDNEIIREFQFKDFKEAMRFANQVADLANQEDHHPEIIISYSRVKLELSTHKIGGLSLNDFILAAKINLI